jgi:serine protease Do
METKHCAPARLEKPSGSVHHGQDGYGKSVEKAPWNILILMLVLILCAAVAASCATEVIANADQGSLPGYLTKEEAQSARVYLKILPAVVTIYTSEKVFKEGAEAQQEAIGSGVLISPQCHILTAAHVVSGAEQIMVKTQDGNMHAAEFLFSEASADIALIRFLKPVPGLQHAELGDSDQLVVGQAAYAIGSPYGLENSFSVGHISGFRDFGRFYDATIPAKFIQTDAAINVGNSGGPLLNSQGQVIGIASRILSVSGGFQGIGFVVPINTAKALLSFKNRFWLGIEGIYLNQEGISKLFNRDLKGGLLVERVAKGSPADRAGLRGGDVPARMLGRDFLLGGDLIISFGTKEACDSDCLAEANKRFAGTDKLPVKFLRGGVVMDTTIDLSLSRRNFLEE